MSDAGWILVVDDDDDTREMVTLLLGLEGYRAIGAADGLDALDRIRTHGRPALILLDLRMPRMNGSDFARALAADPALASTPIVVLSGDAPSAGRPPSFQALDCLTKPVDLAELFGVVGRVVPRGEAGEHPD